MIIIYNIYIYIYIYAQNLFKISGPYIKIL